jgi:hypothetical protein
LVEEGKLVAEAVVVGKGATVGVGTAVGSADEQASPTTATAIRINAGISLFKIGNGLLKQKSPTTQVEATCERYDAGISARVQIAFSSKPSPDGFTP